MGTETPAIGLITIPYYMDIMGVQTIELFSTLWWRGTCQNHYCMMWSFRNGCQNLLTSEETLAPMNILDQEDEVDSDNSEHGGTLLKPKRPGFWMEASWFFELASFELHAPWLHWECAGQSRWTGKGTSDWLDSSMMRTVVVFSDSLLQLAYTTTRPWNMRPFLPVLS